MATSEDPPPSDLAALHQLRLPKFWSSDPQVWFAQVESQFITSKVISQAQKFHHVVAALPPETAMEIRDIILDPPAISPYDVLKAELVKRTSESEQRRLQQLISSEELGDRKPSQLLRRLQQLLGAKAPTFDTAVLRELFLQRLPVNVRMILASASGLVLPELAQLADAVMDVSTPTSTQVAVLQDQRPHLSEAAPCDTPCTLEDIRAEFHREMQNLSVRISAIATRSTSPHKRRLSTRPRRGSPAPTRAKPPETRLCWYHRTFGEDARNCVFPCSASGNASTHH